AVVALAVGFVHTPGPEPVRATEAVVSAAPISRPASEPSASPVASAPAADPTPTPPPAPDRDDQLSRLRERLEAAERDRSARDIQQHAQVTEIENELARTERARTAAENAASARTKRVEELSAQLVAAYKEQAEQ